MTIKDEILEELRKGTLFAEINRRFRSQSQKYEAMREFLGEAKEIVEKMHKEFEELRTDLLGTRTELEKANHEKEEVSGEIQELVQAKEKLSEEVSRKAAKLDRLNAAIEELRGKKFTPEILNKNMAIECARANSRERVLIILHCARIGYWDLILAPVSI